MSGKGTPETLYFKDNMLHLLDQRLLPNKLSYRVCKSPEEVAAAVREMSVRGAPAIGVSAAYGYLLAVIEAKEKGFTGTDFFSHIETAFNTLAGARPTAVNLVWALQRMQEKLEHYRDCSAQMICLEMNKEADSIFAEDYRNNMLIGKHGSALVEGKSSFLTHCNAGALATAGYGTALGVIRASHEEGKVLKVYADETRPLLQGARLTAFELVEEGIPVALITDSCAGSLMQQGKIDLVVVGADRIAANGDTANKIGTYSLAVLASYHWIPFYVAAPLSTIDLSLVTGQDINIENRAAEEITSIGREKVAPDGVEALNPAFDVTPAGLIRAIITEKGVVHEPDRDKIEALFHNW